MRTLLTFLLISALAITASAQTPSYSFVTISDTLYLRTTTTYTNPTRTVTEDLQITDTLAFAEQLKNTAFNLAIQQAGSVQATLFLREGTAQYNTLSTLYNQLTGTGTLFRQAGIEQGAALLGRYSIRDTASATVPIVYARATNAGVLQVATAEEGGTMFNTQLYAFNGTQGRWRIRYNFGTTQSPNLVWLDFFYAGKNDAGRDYWLTTDRRYRLTKLD